MADVGYEWPGEDWTGKKHGAATDGAMMKPWAWRYRWRKPARTYSGKVTYHRPRHIFQERDVLRIYERVMGDGISTETGTYDILYNAWSWVYRTIWRPLLVEVGMEKIFDAIEQYTFERTYDFIIDRTLDVLEPIAEGLLLINTFNDQLPSEEKLHLIKEVDYTNMDFELTTGRQKIESLEAEVESLMNQLSEVLSNG